jgi:polyferredoxin
LSQNEISQRVDKAQVLSAEHESKNWVLILSKFALWFTFLGVVFTLIRKGRITTQVRKWLYLGALLLFGVTLGSSPSPMGAVKDAIALFGSKGVIFPPRMIALTVFFIMVFVANKFICSWGCQFGTLQDLIFRLNRNPRDTKGIFKQYKLPFVVTNTIRVAFFILFTLVAFLWSTNMIEFIDPFKIYNPTVVSSTGWLFLGTILVGSLFVYRPWCTLFCPFGLMGWLVEKLSIFKINVDYETCIECDACAKACPSTAMNAILKQKEVIPDCFACASCIDICPVNSIQLISGKRNSPPADMFIPRAKTSKTGTNLAS